MTRLLLLPLLAVAACGSGNDKPSFYAISLTTPDNTFWAPTIHVGGQSFVMDLDTGSTTTAIAGTACTTCSNVSPEYMPGSKAVDQNESASTEYADGTGWMGEIYEDTINLGSGSPDAMFNLVDISTQVVSGGIEGFFDGSNDYQGILGMGPPENAEPNTGAYFDTITSPTMGGVDPVMAFELCEDGGTMWLGGFDETHAQAAMQYTPMLPISNNNAFYSLDITSMSLNGTVVGMGSDDFEEPVLDTGTTFMYLPTNVAQALGDAINTAAAQAFSGQSFDVEAENVSCVQASGITDDMVDSMMPPLVFSVPSMGSGADISFSVPALESYLFDGGDGQYCLGVGDGGTDFGGVLGDQFLQGFVTVMDVGNSQIGLALDKGCSASASKRRTRDMTTFHPHRPKPRRK
ncbi:MAG TPA: pepsin-like aspartic protease [Kofleriaceae bacterium]|jgi:hypothetical protein